MKPIAFTTLLASALTSGAFLSATDVDEKKEVAVDQTVTITGNDTMQFDVKAFEVKAGSKVKLVLKNVGKVPKIAMGHNLVLLRKGVTAFEFGPKALGAGANTVNPLPDAIKGDVLVHTKLLGPDETDEIVFTAPEEEGDYEYLCTFPGHFALMRGKMTVK